MKFHLGWFGTSGPSNWRVPANNIYDWRTGDIYQDIARLCERAKMDFVLFADTLSVPSLFQGSTDFYVRHGTMISHDPVPAMAMMAAVTNRIGLASTISTTFYPPFLLARLLATLDHLSSGRIGWNVVTSTANAAAQNFGLEAMPEHDTRYDMADEYMELCKALWDSWAPDAVVMDRERGIFADPAKVRPVNYAGKYYRSRGPLNVVSSPQRYPVAIMAGASPRGLRFAAENAEMVIAHKNSVADMRAYIQDLHKQLATAGREPKSCKVFFAIKPIFGETESIARENMEREFETADIELGLAHLSATLGHDMSKFALDEPLPPTLPINALKGKFIQYGIAEKAMTLRQIAQHEAMHETFPICGTPEHVADVLEQTVRDTGADGFHIRRMFQDYNYLLDITTKLVPILQRRGLFRKEYTGTTMRHHLFEY